MILDIKLVFYNVLIKRIEVFLIKPFKSNICSKSFSDKSNLTRHAYIHSDQKKFKCEMCTMSFGTKKKLLKQSSNHSTEKV